MQARDEQAPSTKPTESTLGASSRPESLHYRNMPSWTEEDWRMLMGDAWYALLAPELKKDYMQRLLRFVAHDACSHRIFPPEPLLFRALKETPPSAVKVLILGQDPYHGLGQACGIAFSVPDGVKLPPSLVNIYKELAGDGFPQYTYISKQSGDLTKWVRQGVMLLNTSLTVRENTASSHSKQGWEVFTDECIRRVNDSQAPVAFVLWGAHAQSKKKLITNPIHKVFESVHPSPLSAHRGFFGSRVFSRVNRFLVQAGREPIQW